MTDYPASTPESLSFYLRSALPIDDCQRRLGDEPLLRRHLPPTWAWGGYEIESARADDATFVLTARDRLMSLDRVTVDLALQEMGPLTNVYGRVKLTERSKYQARMYLLILAGLWVMTILRGDVTANEFLALVILSGLLPGLMYAFPTWWTRVHVVRALRALLDAW
jgi:hypothetical protein